VPLGEGSNIVFLEHLDALCLRQQNQAIQRRHLGEGTVILRVDAGHNWHKLVERTLAQGYFGLENLALIPGTVGAAPIQNIGAYGVELERFVHAVHAVELSTGKPLVLTASECAFGYRNSIFKGQLRDSAVITAVDLELRLEPELNLGYPALADALASKGCIAPSPLDVFDAVVAIRTRRLPDPATEPNAGSFFKNPVLPAAEFRQLRQHWDGLPGYSQADGSVKVPAAWLIEQAGWKGYRGDGVGVHEKHALVLVNRGGNSGKALLALADEIAHSVQQRFGVQLEREPRVYGQQQ
jgi:UDP-N-acetylmuramate dehydrogenase